MEMVVKDLEKGVQGDFRIHDLLKVFEITVILHEFIEDSNTIIKGTLFFDPKCSIADE